MTQTQTKRKTVVSIIRLFTGVLLLSQIFSVNAQTTSKPNVIFILADDVGYEVPTVDGGQSYSTPNIDYMAQNGMRFTRCEATPLCSPSRFMLLTGKYNFRNYSIWGYMNQGEKTIGNLMKDAGYATGWFGKLQLYSRDSDIHNLGFDQYLTFENLILRNNGTRYISPLLLGIGGIKLADSATQGKFTDDLITQRLLDFIDSNQSKPFFAYYPMSLCHEPFGPTPDDSAYATWNPNNTTNDTSFFPSMVKYMDKKIGQIITKLQSDGLDQNTIIIFAGDNGTPKGIVSTFDGADFSGEKHSTVEAGTHVPLIVYWPGQIAAGSINSDLIDFTDFFPTLAEAGQNTALDSYGILDGKSFYPRLLGLPGHPRDWVFCHFDPIPDFRDTVERWVEDKTYKLYDNTGTFNSNKFFNIVNDQNELNPIPDSLLTNDELATKNRFQSILDTMPKPPAQPTLSSGFATNITDRSAVLGASIITDGGAPIEQRGSLLWPSPQPAYFSAQIMPDSLSGTGTFQTLRTALLPQTHYSYTLYAMNGNESDNTGFLVVKSGFSTLSKNITKQPDSLIAKAGGCSISLKWNNAGFPDSGATKGGYLLVYSTQTPSLIFNPNQIQPSKVIKNGKIFPLNTSTLPNLPGVTATLLKLPKDSVYNFLLVPYTWNGVSASTYNYLTTGALTATAKVLASQISILPAIQKLSCSGTNDFSITASAINGMSPYRFSFNKSAFDTITIFSNIAPGSYIVKVSDTAGCTGTATVVIKTPTVLSAVNSIANVTCNGGNNGSITVTGTGGSLPPYQYSFNGDAYNTVNIYSGLMAGTYGVNIKDAAGCIASKSVTVKQPAILSLLITRTNISCKGGADGSVKLAGRGGTVPYQYSFNGSAYDTVSLFTGLIAGTYAVSVKDKNSCIFSSSAKLTQSTTPCSSLLAPTSTSESLSMLSGLKVGIYPNPSQAQFNLVVGNTAANKPVLIKVVDMYGKVRNSIISAPGHAYIFGNSLAAGVYVVQVQQGNEVKTIKIIKSR